MKKDEKSEIKGLIYRHEFQELTLINFDLMKKMNVVYGIIPESFNS